MDIGKLLFRPIREEDLPAVCQVAAMVGPGFTSLPNDVNFIQKKIMRSIQSFNEENPKESRFYFFVLEDLATHKVVGTAAIEASVSHFNPYHNYLVATKVQRSEFLKYEKSHTILIRENNYQNASALGTLFIDSEYRGLKRGEFLSRARFLFIAEFSDLFSDTFIAEIRGYVDEQGISPFWQVLGEHFCEKDFKTANTITSIAGTEVVAGLLPNFPVYACMFPESVQDVIGKAHLNAEAAKHVLEKEGFAYRQHVDILDAGPILEVEKHSIKTLKENRKLKVKEYASELEGNLSMVSNAIMKFRATFGRVVVVKENDGTEAVILEQEVADRLEVKIGSWVRFSKLD